MRSLSRLSSTLVGVGALGMSLMSAGCGVQTFQEPTAHFDRYRTLSFEIDPEPPSGSAPLAIETQAKVERAAVAGLKELGYLPIMAKEPADLVVVVQAGRDWRRSPSSIAVVRGSRPKVWLMGVLVVEAFERETGRLVWSGSTETGVDLVRMDPEELRLAMGSILSSFPARSRSSLPAGGPER